MALLGQDFTKFQKDSFYIKFTITDATTSLSGYKAWWGCYSGDVSNYPGSQTNTPVIQKSTTGWSTGAEGSPNFGGVTMGSNTVTIQLTQSDFNGNGISGKLSEGEYYHELVLGNSDNGSDSVVVANGTMTINPSLFTNQLYRW